MTSQPSFSSQSFVTVYNVDIIILLVLNSMSYFYCFYILWFAIGLGESANHVEALWTALGAMLFSTSERQVQPHFVKQIKKNGQQWVLDHCFFHKFQLPIPIKREMLVLICCLHFK
jgi:hypothetical protein